MIKRTALVAYLEEHFKIDLGDYLEIAYYGEGLSMHDIAEELGVSESTVYNWLSGQDDYVSFTKDRKRAVQRAVEIAQRQSPTVRMARRRA